MLFNNWHLIKFWNGEMNSNSINIFFLGKGGVGKSTSSALTALHLVNSGKKVLLASMDPAHNQSDILQIKLSEKPKEIRPDFFAKEVDVNYWVKKYLEDVTAQIKHSYSYLTAFNLESYLDVIKFSPGIEEYALLTAYKEIRRNNTDKDYIVFDMPPTALTIKFLGLPKTSNLWLEKLLDLRNKILKKKEIITKIKLGKTEVEQDKILNKLNAQINSYSNVKSVFENETQTILNLVLNTDKLSFSESKLIVKNLKGFNLRISNIFVNKYSNGFNTKEIESISDVKGIQIFPDSTIPLLGLERLSQYLKAIDTFIDF